MIIKKIKKIFFASVIVFLYPVICFGRVYYVGQNGTGNMDGSDISNLMSVDIHNQTSFNPGDVIKLCGEITDTVMINGSGTENEYIVYTGECENDFGYINTIQANGIEVIGKNHIKIEHLEISSLNNAISIYGGCNDIVINSCNIHDTLYKGIVVTDIENGNNPTSDITIINNTIHNVGTGTAGGDIVLAYIDGFLIQGNHLYATKNNNLSTDRGIDGIAFEHASNGIVEHNIIHDHNDNYYDDPLGNNYAPREGRGEDGIDVKALSHDIIIRFNEIYNHNFQTGITIQSGSYNIEIHDNNIHDNLWCGILLKDSNHNSSLCDDGHSTNNINIFANSIIANKKRGISVESGCDGVERVTITDNTFALNAGEAEHTPDSAIFIAGGDDDFEINNNIFYNNYSRYNTHHHIYSSSGVTNLSITNNTFHIDAETSMLYLDGQLKGINEDPRTSQNLDADPHITVDITPPIVSNGVPTGEQPVNTTTVNLGVNTNENATCRYSTKTNQCYHSMTVFANTGGTTHTTTVSGLNDGYIYQYYVKCQDNNNNTNTDDYIITFSVNSSSYRTDVNNDSQTNSTDALLTLRHSLGLSMTDTDWQESSITGDANCDGTTNSTDALLILRYSLGLDMNGTGWCGE